MWNVECAGSPWNSRNTERDSTNSKFRIPNSQLHDSPSRAYRLLRDRPHRRDNVPGRDTGPIEQFFRLPAARDLADRETVHDHAGIGHGRRHGVADAARCVMVLDGEQLARLVPYLHLGRSDEKVWAQVLQRLRRLDARLTSEGDLFRLTVRAPLKQ